MARRGDRLAVFNREKRVKMKINSNYKLRRVVNEFIIVRQGKGGTDLTRVISLNEAARLLWEQLQDEAFTADDAAGILVKTYGIPRDQALQDAQGWIKEIRANGLLEDEEE